MSTESIVVRTRGLEKEADRSETPPRRLARTYDTTEPHIHCFLIYSWQIRGCQCLSNYFGYYFCTFDQIPFKPCYSESRVALYDFRDEPKYLDQTQVPRIDFSRVVFINACCRSLHVRYLNADNYFETLALTLSLAFQTLLSSLHKRESKHSDANNQSIGFCHNCKIYN